MDRRNFLKKATLLTMGLTTPAGIVLANADYSMKSNPSQNKYQYENPFTKKEAPKSTTVRGSSSNRAATNQINNNSANLIIPRQNSEFWEQPRSLKLMRTQTGENAHIVYYENGKINQKGYELACYLLRDVQANEVINIDLTLLDLMCAVQAWIVHLGYDEYLRVSSGYRSKKTNNRTEGAAKNSMHLYGKAVDFRVSGLKSSEIAEIAKAFAAGGIGIYHRQNFIHLDTGRVRMWNR